MGVILVVQVEPGDAVHGGLAGDEVQEVVPLGLGPGLDREGQVELDHHAVEPVVMAGALGALGQSQNALGHIAVESCHVGGHGELGPDDTLLQAVDRGIGDGAEIGDGVYAHGVSFHERGGKTDQRSLTPRSWSSFARIFWTTAAESSSVRVRSSARSSREKARDFLPSGMPGPR